MYVFVDHRLTVNGFVVLKKGLTPKMCICFVLSYELRVPFNRSRVWILFWNASSHPCFRLIFFTMRFHNHFLANFPGQRLCGCALTHNQSKKLHCQVTEWR